MGTNYYATSKCSACGHEESYHIGKSSACWTFSLHVEPNRNVNSLEDVYRICMKADNIKNEYGDALSMRDLASVIEDRGVNSYASSGVVLGLKFLLQNHAIQDRETGLLRHAIDGTRCIGHGDGPWDLIVGEFS